MKIIRLDLAHHNGENIVLIQFPIDNELQTIVRTIPNRVDGVEHFRRGMFLIPLKYYISSKNNSRVYVR
jgi:hypothetical protein